MLAVIADNLDDFDTFGPRLWQPVCYKRETK